MKKTLKVAAAAAMLATPALATSNLENPLYLTKKGDGYAKVSAGLMIKKADSSDAHKLKLHDGEIEFPIWRFAGDFGYGITDRFMVHGSVGYTHDGDIDRKGMHLGRVGFTYRSFASHEDFVWDWYADLHMGGVSAMEGTFDLGTLTFQYDNYSNGRWGFHAGTKLGKTWGGFTGAVFAEIQQTFGNHNNEIKVAVPAPGLEHAADLSVNLKPTTEFNAGIKAFWQIDDRWSWGTQFTYKHHVDNGVKSLHSIDYTSAAAEGFLTPRIPALLAGFENMKDGFDEYIVGLSVARQMTDSVQVALYGEYTFDTAHKNSQNGTDLKAEAGVRVNVRF